MNEENKLKKQMSHSLSLDGRKALSLSGVVDVGSFDDKSITAQTSAGVLNIKGENLNIKKLNLEIGELDVTGYVSSLNYTDKKTKSESNFFSKLFK